MDCSNKIRRPVNISGVLGPNYDIFYLIVYSAMDIHSFAIFSITRNIHSSLYDEKDD